MANPTGKGGLQNRKHQINRNGRPKSFDALRGWGGGVGRWKSAQRMLRWRWNGGRR